VWRKDRIQELLSTEDADVLFLSGCAQNIYHPTSLLEQEGAQAAIVRRAAGPLFLLGS
jgi:hypothetical protein